MGRSSPSSDLIHMWTVTATIYSIGCCITWVCTYKLLVGFNNKLKEKGNRSMKQLERSQVISALVCIGSSIGLPLQCVQMIYFDQAEDRALKDDDKDKEWVDYLNVAMALGFGVPSIIFIFGTLYADMYLNITKLNVFDRTISEASDTRKLVYRWLIWTAILMCVIWALWFPFSGATITLYAIYTVLLVIYSMVVQIMLAREFQVRLSGFIESTRLKFRVLTHSSSDNLSGSMPDDSPSHASSPSTEMKSEDRSLLKVIIKQSLLTMIKILGVVMSGVMFAISVSLVRGVLNAYLRIGVMQVAVTLPLCVYLSLGFAGNEYNWLCLRLHGWIERSAVATVLPPPIEP